MQSAMAYAHYIAGRYAEALLWAETAARDRLDHGPALRVLAAASAMTGRQQQAEKAVARLRELYPALRISNLRQFVALRPDDVISLAVGLGKAGLPD
jgi:adenylate cyclase